MKVTGKLEDEEINNQFIYEDSNIIERIYKKKKKRGKIWIGQDVKKWKRKLKKTVDKGNTTVLLRKKEYVRTEEFI